MAKARSLACRGRHATGDAGPPRRRRFRPSCRKYDKRTLAADCAAVLDAAGVDGPVTVAGHDIGAMVAYAFARRFPERTTGTRHSRGADARTRGALP
ncbi:alpha/beta fold hydrolase [Ancylobacter oerskovii]|uniref:Alpha/beta fold hydrolase n=1 Tax=Ancylobacter oerskovii TaxID=459519 RepID=A0ABW4Z530_9HYPH